jgi:putative membrane protein
MWYGGDGMGWWMLWGGLMMVLFWGGVIALIVWGVQAATRKNADQAQPPPRADSSPTALDIAKRRYARGDITREEFEQIKTDLEDQ